MEKRHFLYCGMFIGSSCVYSSFPPTHSLCIKLAHWWGKKETDLVWSNHKGISYKTAERFSLIFVNFRLESLAEEALSTISVI